MKKIFLIILLSSVFCAMAQESPKYEFRAVWIATVSNIDWPSKPGLSSEEQKKEAHELLDLIQKNGMNAVILQIRPSADGIYPSDVVPWSRYLTGTPGVAPEPYYDPLQFWIEECHKRGLEFHAWFNPFRVAQNYKEQLAGNHIAFNHPDWILKYGDRLYFDPGIPEVRNHILRVVIDVVKRYDVDAIHFDDYFYPYPLKDEFPDTTSFANFNRGYTIERKADWRRGNVDMIIKNLSDSIKATKPWVKFGISPFGVWRNYNDDPDGSLTTAGTTNYDHLFADVVKWQKEGWIDYLLPQLYWQIGHPLVDFQILANWWGNHSYGRNLYIGQGLYRINEKPVPQEWKQPGQLPDQVKILRNIETVNGSAFYSSKHLKFDLLGFQDSLQSNYYKHPAIIPHMPWIDNTPPLPPEEFKKSGKKIKWKRSKQENEFDKQVQFVVYKNETGENFNPATGNFIDRITTSTKIAFSRINKKRKKYEVRISALDRLNNESVITNPVIIKM